VNIDDMILVSVDDHVIEPPGIFDGRLPTRYADLAPRLERDEQGVYSWTYGGSEYRSVGLNAVAGRPRSEFGIEPASFDDMRPGCFDIHERVKDMDANGVLGSMCFPSMPQFCGQLFARTPDKDVAAAMIRAYNDWHVDEWCGTYPGRFIPLGLPMMWDPDLLAAEVHRLAAKGCRAVTFSENPAAIGYPSLHSDYWDPFWAACADERTVVCMHIGSSSQLVVTASDAPMDVLITCQPVTLLQCAADLIWSPMFRKFPDLRVALSEGGIGWIPYFLERIDYVYDHHKAWTGQDFGSQLPSEVFNEHVITCFIDDAVGVENRGHLNMDNITWECDYPHSDSTWPTSPETAKRYLEGLSDEEIDKITHLNAMVHFSYDPFAHRERAECTVGALRRQALGHDVSVQARGRRSATTAAAPTKASDLAAVRGDS
jgi:hypothetical protein